MLFLWFVLILTVQEKWFSMYNRNVHDCIHISIPVPLHFGYLYNWKTTAWNVSKYGVFFWSVFSCIRTEYRKIRTRKNSVFGHFSRGEHVNHRDEYGLALRSLHFQGPEKAIKMVKK